MNQTTRLEMLDVPVVLALADIETTPLCAFFALGTVNPYGPTLAFAAALGPWASGARASVVRAVIDPFAQAVQQVGWVDMGDDWQPQELLAPLLALDLGECPSLLLLNAAVPASEREALAFEILSRREAGAAERLTGVERYFAQPYERVGWEMQGAASEAVPVMTAESYAWLARLLLDPRHCYPELGAFLFAWRGSVEEVPMAEEKRASAFGFDRFAKFFSDRVCALLALPEKPAADAPAERAASPAGNRYQPESIAALDEMLARQDWRAMPPDQQHDVLKAALLAYGMGLDPKYLRETGTLYAHLIGLPGAEAGARLQVLREVNDAMRELPLQAEVFLPFLAFEPDRGVVARLRRPFARPWRGGRRDARAARPAGQRACGVALGPRGSRDPARDRRRGEPRRSGRRGGGDARCGVRGVPPSMAGAAGRGSVKGSGAHAAAGGREALSAAKGGISDPGFRLRLNAGLPAFGSPS